MQSYILEADQEKLISRNQKNLPRFPSTRYQGSKRKILPALAEAFSRTSFSSALDLYSGSGSVALLLRYLGKKVDANDYLLFNQAVARLFLSFKRSDLELHEIDESLRRALHIKPSSSKYVVHDAFKGIFFTDEENLQIDNFCQNIADVEQTKRDLLIYGVGQALMKKRPYNLFHRANLSMRTRDVERSFGNAVTWEKSIYEHAIKAIYELKSLPFSSSSEDSQVFGVNTNNVASLPAQYDLVYLDPPYINSKGTGLDYSDFYGFLDGLCDYDLFSKSDPQYPHRPLYKKPCAWLKSDAALDSLAAVVEKWRSSVIFLSYRNDGRPSPSEAAEVLSSGGRKVEIHSCGGYKYALSRAKTSEELFLISLP